MSIRPWILASAVVVAAATPYIAISQIRGGYLPSGTLDIVQVLPPAPLKGDQRYKADRKIFKATRPLLTTPRGDLATRDVATGIPYMASAFSCAVGVVITPENAPLTIKLIGKSGIDTGTQSGTAKNAFKRLRPFQIDKRKICQPAAQLKGSFDYPSGHTTWGWTWALILAELAPDRATPILARGRAYGESRIVCGAHNASAVQTGFMTASATLAADHAQPGFQADVAAARAELAALRANPATAKPEGCDAQAKLVAQPIL
ncbi:MAG: phosphatase PAP2 family protein [Pseudomonadota bacterium]